MVTRSGQVLNRLLVKLFNQILAIEEQAIKISGKVALTMSEMHILEAIGPHGPKSMSEIAAERVVTQGTVTTAINRLVRKGYVFRYTPEEDRRLVMVKLTDSGKAAYEAHEAFHANMIASILEGLTKEEEVTLIRAADKLNKFFAKVDPRASKHAMHEAAEAE